MMERRVALLLAAAILAASVPASAGIFGKFGKKGEKEPEALSFLNQSHDDSHKAGHRAEHDRKYTQPEWGNIWKQTLKPRELRINPYVSGHR